MKQPVEIFLRLSFVLRRNRAVTITLRLQNWKTVPMYKNVRASLVAQWLRICLLMQGTRVRALVWEDPTCRGAAGPVSHNC